MNMFQTAVEISVFACMPAATVHGDQWDKSTVITFSQLVEIPGRLMSVGSAEEDEDAGLLERLCKETGGVAHFPRTTAAVAIESMHVARDSTRLASRRAFGRTGGCFEESRSRCRPAIAGGSMSAREPGISRLGGSLEAQRAVGSRCLAGGGRVLLGYVAYVDIDARAYQVLERRRSDDLRLRAASPSPTIVEGDAIGEILVPRIGLRVMVAPGESTQAIATPSSAR